MTCRGLSPIRAPSGIIAALAPALVLAGVAGADVTLAPIFAEDMVVQRDVPLHVWGTADPGEAVEVDVGWQQRRTHAGEDGRWRVTLAPLPGSSRPITFKVLGRNEIVLHNVLAGELWICAGQSNMQWPLSRDERARQALAGADRPQIRLYQAEPAATGRSGRFTADQVEALVPDRFCPGSWSVCTPRTARSVSAIGYYFAVDLQRTLGVPVGIVDVAVGGTPTESWISARTLAGDDDLRDLVATSWLENRALDAWCQRRARHNLEEVLAAGRAPGDAAGPNHPFKPGFMWSTAMAPLAGLSTRGVLWYQGESNAETAARVAQHERLFTLLVDDWRDRWLTLGHQRLTFLYVQLPAMGRPHWPAFREQQRQLLPKLGDAGLAVTIDVGDATDVHPRRKKPVGERLARLARSLVHETGEVPTGPLVRRATADGPVVEVEFDHAGDDLTTRDGATPASFEIAGEDGRFHPATAKISGTRVHVACDRIQRPRFVRYAWAPVPDANLVNDLKLPASPFTIAVDP